MSSLRYVHTFYSLCYHELCFVGDAVRCVGKLMASSWLHIFKISKVEYNKPLISRLFSLANFAISNLKNSNVK